MSCSECMRHLHSLAYLSEKIIKVTDLKVRVQYAVTEVRRMFWRIFTSGYPDHKCF